MRCALTIAGSDSIGGAGVEADVKAMSSVGVHACAVVTAVTAQNTCEVSHIYPVPADMIRCQLDAILKDIDIKAVKTGMLYSADIVKSVAEVFEDHRMPFIVDPVMAAGVGNSLALADLSQSIKKDIMPLCELITPNRHEAEILAGMSIRTEYDAELACEIIGKGGSSVLLKGGHMDGKNVIDYFYLSSQITKMEYPRLERAGHGGGCILSSYITAYMAKGFDIFDAVKKSRDLIQESIASMYIIGKGDKCVNPTVGSFKNLTKFRILDEIDDAADILIDIMPKELVPTKGIMLAYSLENPIGPEDIATIDNEVTFYNGRLRKGGKPKYGVQCDASRALFSVATYDRDIRSLLNVAYSENLLDVMEEVGFDVLTLGSRRYENYCLNDVVAEAIRRYGRVPDVLVDEDVEGCGSIQLLGKNPRDLLNKLRLVL
ncbi:MAG: bifunctional hydroxymethylpyrimidine kinase/phosphomethylpyrimidine kinase [archaeon]|nr:bifunctional hydroxymethylpyrimidine kinase/phosphomethylpyrimidine kinase [archaeon]